MKSKILCSLAVIAFSVQTQAAIYTTDFESFNSGDNVTDGANAGYGWTTNGDASLSPVNNWNPTLDPSLVDPMLGNQAAVIGWYAGSPAPLPAQPTIDLSHGCGETIINAGNGYGTHVALDFSILDSSPAQPNRDTFGISLTATGGANIFQLVFTPTVVASINTWDVTYTVGGGGSGNLGHFNTLVDPSTGLRSTGTDTLGLSFSSKDASSAFYHVTMLINGSLTTQTGTIAMAPGTLIDKFNATWTPVSTANPGDNYLLIDNLVMVPEASTSLLLCVAGMSLALRRKRA